MSVRGIRHRLPGFLIGAMLLIIGAAVVIEVETDKDVGGVVPTTSPVEDVESRSFVVGQEPGDVIFDGEKLWVAETGFGTVTSYGRDGQRLDTADVGGMPGRLASGAGFVWVLDADDGSVTQLDENAAIIRKFLVGVEPVSIEFLGDHIWVTDPARDTVSQVSTQGDLANQIAMDVSSGVMTRTPEQILVVDSDSRTITGIDHAGKPVATFHYPERVELDGFQHALGIPTAFISTPEALWLAFGGVGQVMRFTPAGVQTAVTRVSTGLLSMAWVEDELWVASDDAGTITRLSPTGEIIKTHPIGGSPAAITYDGENVWVVDDERNVLTMLLP